MRVKLVFVPPGGGEVDFSMMFDVPMLPQQGDYLAISRPGQTGTEDFIVRRTWWSLDYPHGENDDPEEHELGRVKAIYLECEFAVGHMSSESHMRSCDIYRKCGKPLRKVDESCY